jgi:ABC-type Fe3+ transport system substrate-binding protein
MKGIAGIALAVGLLLALPATTGSAEAADLAQLKKEAMDAGQKEVMVYLPAARAFQPLFDKFKADYPEFTVNTTELFGPALFARLEAERASGTMTADVIVSGELDFPVLAEDGWLQSYSPAGSEKLDATYVGADNRWIVWGLGPVGVMVNTTAVSKQGPHRWKDVLAAEFAGKIIINNPETPTTSTLSMATLYHEGRIDKAWTEAFAALKPTVAASTSAMLQAIATGQATVAPFMPYALYRVAKAQGAPVEFWFMEDGNPAMPLSAGVVDKAPHDKAAAFFVSYLISEAGTAAGPALGQLSPVPGTPWLEGAPANLEVLALTGKTLQDALQTWKAEGVPLLAK